MKIFLLNFVIWLAFFWLINSIMEHYAGRGFFFLTGDIVILRCLIAAFFSINRPIIKI